jgi:hypothetical protein
MLQPPQGFAVKKTVLTVACSGLAIVIPVACFWWLQYPHVKLTIFNESSRALCDVRVKFLYGERIAERIEPGGSAVTDIQSGGDAGVFFSYLRSGESVRKREVLYYSDEHGAPDRGYFEAHVTNEGTRHVNGVYTVVNIGVRTFRVSPRGRMSVK